jgi:hypothetical protein
MRRRLDLPKRIALNRSGYFAATTRIENCPISRNLLGMAQLLRQKQEVQQAKNTKLRQKWEKLANRIGLILTLELHKFGSLLARKSRCAMKGHNLQSER